MKNLSIFAIFLEVLCLLNFGEGAATSRLKRKSLQGSRVQRQGNHESWTTTKGWWESPATPEGWNVPTPILGWGVPTTTQGWGIVEPPTPAPICPDCNDVLENCEEEKKLIKDFPPLCFDYDFRNNACRKSCFQCRICGDNYDKCEEIKRYCDVGIYPASFLGKPISMKIHCKKTCGHCDNDPRCTFDTPKITTTTEKPITPSKPPVTLAPTTPYTTTTTAPPTTTTPPTTTAAPATTTPPTTTASPATTTPPTTTAAPLTTTAPTTTPVPTTTTPQTTTAPVTTKTPATTAASLTTKRPTTAPTSIVTRIPRTGRPVITTTVTPRTTTPNLTVHITFTCNKTGKRFTVYKTDKTKYHKTQKNANQSCLDHGQQLLIVESYQELCFLARNLIHDVNKATETHVWWANGYIENWQARNQNPGQWKWKWHNGKPIHRNLTSSLFGRNKALYDEGNCVTVRHFADRNLTVLWGEKCDVIHHWICQEYVGTNFTKVTAIPISRRNKPRNKDVEKEETGVSVKLRKFFNSLMDEVFNH